MDVHIYMDVHVYTNCSVNVSVYWTVFHWLFDFQLRPGALTQSKLRMKDDFQHGFQNRRAYASKMQTLTQSKLRTIPNFNRTMVYLNNRAFRPPHICGPTFLILTTKSVQWKLLPTKRKQQHIGVGGRREASCIYRSRYRYRYRYRYWYRYRYRYRYRYIL